MGEINSAQYWIDRYESSGTSGPGSRGRLAEFKAEILNGFVAEHKIASVIEFGCGDGYQLGLASYPSYLGFDVSEAAIAQCRNKFSGDDSKCFRLMADYAGETADMALSLDVIYHLLEDEVFGQYIATLFAAAQRYVVIFSNNFEDVASGHCRPRQFTNWIKEHAAGWVLSRHIVNRYPFVADEFNESDADFYIYERKA